jgi:hypothetical protein
MWVITSTNPGALVTERHADQLEPHREQVARQNQGALRTGLESSVRIGEEDLQVEHQRNQVEDLPDGRRQLRVGPGEVREKGRVAGRDHQRAEAAVGSPPPGDDAAEDVGDLDQAIERGLEPGVLDVIAVEGEQKARGADRKAAEREHAEQRRRWSPIGRCMHSARYHGHGHNRFLPSPCGR